MTGFKFRQGFDVGMEYLFGPIVIVLIIITVISIVLGIRQAKLIMSEGDVQTGGKRAPLVFLLIITGYFGISFFDASLISDRLISDKFFPMLVSGIGFLCCVVLLLTMQRRPDTDTIFADWETSEEAINATHGLWPTLAWFAFLLVMTSLVGFILALMIFLLTFMRVRAGLSWSQSAIYTVCGIVFMCFMAWILNRDFPPGLLQSWFDLPWPLT